jgi:hypothetical protein
MKRGCGFLTFHFSTFAPNQYADQVMNWNGGYFQWETDGKRQWYSAITTKETEVQLGTPGHPVALVRGEGVRVWDSEGKEYLDFTGGIAVTALGHSHPRVVGTMREQAATLLHVSNLFYIPQQIHLAKLLCDHSFADRVFFSNSGAEANETAIKLARKWAKEHGASDRGDIISMRGGFHGRTLATVTATAQEKYHHGFEPLPGGFKYVPFNDLRAVERAIDSRTAGVLVEPIQGEGGVYLPDDDVNRLVKQLIRIGASLVDEEPDQLLPDRLILSNRRLIVLRKPAKKLSKGLRGERSLVCRHRRPTIVHGITGSQRTTYIPPVIQKLPSSKVSTTADRAPFRAGPRAMPSLGVLPGGFGNTALP